MTIGVGPNLSDMEPGRDDWRARVECGDWTAITRDVNGDGDALLPPGASAIRSSERSARPLVFCDAA